MNYISFITYLANHLKIDVQELLFIEKTYSLKTVKKGDFLLQEGQYCQHTFFVEKGLLRQYTIDEKGKEHILYFAPESWFISDRASLFFQQTSSYFIQALEDCELRMLDEAFITEISKKYPEFVAFNNKLLHNHIRHLQHRVTSLLGATAEERYLHFIDLYPDITVRVPQSMIASYLGITPESLSRVRKELASRHTKMR